MQVAAGQATRTLYRHLLRAAAPFDKQPALRSLLTLYAAGSRLGVDPSAADAALLRPVPLVSYDAASSSPGLPESVAHVADSLSAWLRPSRMHPPGSPLTAALPMPLRDAIRQMVRDNVDAPSGAGLLPLYTAVAILQHVMAAAEAELARPQAATPQLPESLSAALRPLQASAALRPHCLMLEHPSVLGPGRAALLVYDISKNVREIHGNEDWTVRAYSVNRPFPNTVAAVTGRTDLGAFGDLSLFHGGPDHENLSVIHRHGDIPGAQAIDPEAADADASTALYIGGDVAAINARLKAGTVQPADFKVVMGATTFKLSSGASARFGDSAGPSAAAAANPTDAAATDALALPDDDAWWLAEGPGVVDYALLPAQFDTTGLFRDGRGLGAQDAIEGYNHARFWHQNAAWSAALRSVADSLSRANATASNAGDAQASGAAAYEGSAHAGWPQLLRACADLHPAVTHGVARRFPMQIQVPAVLQKLAAACAAELGSEPAAPLK